LKNKPGRKTKDINLGIIGFIVFVSFNGLTNQGIKGD
jgi:hypothetical protein